MSRPGDSYIYYRMKARVDGCNLSTRKRRRDKFNPSSRSFPDILSKGDSPNGGSD